jgi:hypothetical protein
VTETEWLTSTDPRPMLEFVEGRASDHPPGSAEPLLPIEPMPEFVEGRASDRKLRLFACACCRRVWHLLAAKTAKHLVGMAETYADGEGSHDALCRAWKRLLGMPWNHKPPSAMPTSRDAAYAAAAYAARPGPMGGGLAIASQTARCAAYARRDARKGQAEQDASENAERKAQAALLREIIGGNPLVVPSALPDAVLAWNNGMVRRIAQALYEQRKLPEGTLDASRLAVLADALEDAGWTEADLLGHLRAPGPQGVLGSGPDLGEGLIRCRRPRQNGSRRDHQEEAMACDGTAGGAVVPVRCGQICLQPLLSPEALARYAHRGARARGRHRCLGVGGLPPHGAPNRRACPG